MNGQILVWATEIVGNLKTEAQFKLFRTTNALLFSVLTSFLWRAVHYKSKEENMPLKIDEIKITLRDILSIIF
jgi:hypothetical protein